MTREQRVELLKLAREAKQKKKLERDAEKPKPVMGRPKKIKNKEETFEAPKEEEIPKEDVEDVKMKVSDDEIDKLLDKPKTRLTYKERSQNRSLDLKLKEPKKEQDDEEEEIQEEIIYKKEPKKKILRKIIYEESTDDEVEEVIIDNRKNKPVQKEAKVKKVSKPVPLNAPKEPEIKSGFNFFKY